MPCDVVGVNVVDLARRLDKLIGNLAGLLCKGRRELRQSGLAPTYLGISNLLIYDVGRRHLRALISTATNTSRTSCVPLAYLLVDQ